MSIIHCSSWYQFLPFNPLSPSAGMEVTASRAEAGEVAQTYNERIRRQGPCKESNPGTRALVRNRKVVGWREIKKIDWLNGERTLQRGRA